MRLYRWAAAAAALTATIAAAAPAASAGTSWFPKPPAELARVAKQVFGPAHDDTAVCLSWWESRYNTSSRVAGSSWSRTGDHGWWQANYLAHHRAGESEWSFHYRLRPLLASALEARAISAGGTSWWAWTGTYARGYCRGLS